MGARLHLVHSGNRHLRFCRWVCRIGEYTNVELADMHFTGGVAEYNRRGDMHLFYECPSYNLSDRILNVAFLRERGAVQFLYNTIYCMKKTFRPCNAM
ncbi:hypothetical protein AVEN_273-1 [Araneus ventricosus]|uniref:Uncharacterized protein n=1 Tax=Araneus ventricosus TaxID=182803 RepID=A0A4Y2CPW0_ARAVE|nr:hypothetical protein AVEN_273-1 [Araneus ventricosus]